MFSKFLPTYAESRGHRPQLWLSLLGQAVSTALFFAGSVAGGGTSALGVCLYAASLVVMGLSAPFTDFITQMTTEVCDGLGHGALEDGLGYVGAWGFFVGFVAGLVLTAVSVAAFPGAWKGGPYTGSSSCGIAFACYALAAAFLASPDRVRESLPPALRTPFSGGCGRFAPTWRTRHPSGADTTYFSNFKVVVMGFMFLDAYFFAIVTNFFLWKRLMSIVVVYLYGFVTILVALPSVRFVTESLGAPKTVRVALLCYVCLLLIIALAPAASTAGRAQVWGTLPFVGAACCIVPAFQTLLYSQYPVDARAEIISWWKIMAVGVPKALGSAVGGIVLSACIRRDPNASNYLVGAVPHAVLVVGALGLLVLHERNERDYGHESLYVPPPAKAKVEARAPAKGVTEQVAHSY